MPRRAQVGRVQHAQQQWSLAQSNLPYPLNLRGPDPTCYRLNDADVTWHCRTGLPVMAYTATAFGYFGENPGKNAARNDNPLSRPSMNGPGIGPGDGWMNRPTNRTGLLCTWFPPLPSSSAAIAPSIWRCDGRVGDRVHDGSARLAGDRVKFDYLKANDIIPSRYPSIPLRPGGVMA